MKRRYASPPSGRFRVKAVRLPLRKRLGLTVRDVSGYLDQPDIRDVLSPDEVKIYKRWADGNFSRKDFAAWLGFSEDVLDIYMDHLERLLLQRALFRGVSLREQKTLPSPEDFRDKDHSAFQQDRDREAQEGVELADFEGRDVEND